MSSPVEGPIFLRQLVTPEDVASLLIGRSPRLLSDPNRREQVQSLITGTATEIAAIVGDPPPAPVAALATWALTLGAASAIEDSMFPEQQNGDATRRYSTKYLAVLAQLRADPSGTGVESGSGTVASPRGSFPPAEAYPDPARPFSWGPWGGLGWAGRP